LKRFIVVHVDDAIKGGYPDDHGMLEHANRWRDSFWCLYETDGEKPIRFVGNDGGEPEDQRLFRNWKWVVDELNALAGPALAWSTERPTDHGAVYYVREPGEPLLVGVIRAGPLNELLIDRAGASMSHRIAGFHPDTLWCRLPEPPREPSE
jgi:hypothetical protein